MEDDSGRPPSLKYDPIKENASKTLDTHALSVKKWPASLVYNKMLLNFSIEYI
jgi:hypothetical protein